MINITYKPEHAGQEFLNHKGQKTRVRKYHLTDEEMLISKERWNIDVKEIDEKVKAKVGKIFFNPYRYGIYYYQIQTLFFLGANEWHSLADIVAKLEEYVSSIPLLPTIVQGKSCRTAWDQFRGKNTRLWARSSKDYIGRIQENFVMLQRLSRMTPYGYKLYQVCSAIDMKRVSMSGFLQGLFYYRLSTYPNQAEALPIKDFSEFIFDKNESKYVNNKFVGTIVTMDKVMKLGVTI